MTTLTLTALDRLRQTVRTPSRSSFRRTLTMVILIALAGSSAELRTLILETISEAYLAVTIFVAGTLALFYGLESGLKIDLGALLSRHRRWQVPAAALLGAFPGCGGAIIVVTQYTKGHLSLGSVVATLTATMGDAAFLLLAQQPVTGLGILALGFTTGIVSGYLVDAFVKHPYHSGAMKTDPPSAQGPGNNSTAEPSRALVRLWFALLAPAGILGLLLVLQIDTDRLFGPLASFEPTLWIGVAGAVLSLFMWTLQPSESDDHGTALSSPESVSTPVRILHDTTFITAWVIFGFLAFELGVYFSGVELAAWFEVWAPLLPLMAILVGFLPGCGPQIVVTTLYLNGAIPLSAQIGNAISNDGDALFPALALAPKAAVMATLYSAIPAVLIAYGYYFLWEG